MEYERLNHKKEQTIARKDNHHASTGGRILEDNRPQMTIQRQQVEALASFRGKPVQKKENNTGLPDGLKLGIENLSGYAMDDVRVHYNSQKPAQLHAHAYAQGTDIHLGNGQEKHLPHEAWHVVQQKQGRVRPTIQLKDKVSINDEETLETEADVMGAKALQSQEQAISQNTQAIQRMPLGDVIQKVDLSWWGRAALGGIGAIAGGGIGAAKGLYKEGFGGVVKGAQEGAQGGYERPGAALGAATGAALGYMAGGVGAVGGGLVGAATGAYKTGSATGTILGGVTGAAAGYVAPTVLGAGLGATVGGMIGNQANEKKNPQIPWQLYINPKDFGEASRLPYPGKMYDRDKSPGYQKNMEQALSQELSPGALGRRVNYEEYVRLHDLVTERLRGDGVSRVTTRESIRTPSSVDAATGFPINDWDDRPMMPAEDLMNETIGGMPMIKVFDPENPMKIRNNENEKENRSVTLYDPMETGGEDMFRVRYTEEEGQQYVTSIFNRYYDEIGAAETPEDRINAIVKVIRAIHVTHPFKDANGRLHIQLMLNKFLLEQGFSPTVLGARGLGVFGGALSIDELREEVKTGMIRHNRMKREGM